MEKIYTSQQVADLLQVSIITVRRYIKSGKLPASKLGKDYRIRESDINQLFEKQRVNKPPRGERAE